MGSLNRAAAAAAAASSGRKWHHQLNPIARPRMRTTMLESLRTHLPVDDVRRRKIATDIEQQCYNASANQFDYFKNIAAVIKRVEKQYQNHRHPAPSLPQQGNNPAHSSARTLISQQQTEQPDSSTLVQASSLSSDGQSSTGDSQTSALHNTSGQSTIGQMHPTAIQSATQSGIRHNPYNTVQQPMNQQQQQQHPEPSTSQQFSVQQIERTQQSLQQPVSGELSNLHPHQPNNLLNQHETQEFMSLQSQHQEYAAFHGEDNLWEYAQLSPLRIESSGNEDSDFWLSCLLSSPCSEPLTLSEIQDDNATMYDVGVQEILECKMNIDKSADIQSSVSDTQMKNIGDEEDGLAAKEDPNSVFMTDMPTNPKKRKYDGSSSSAPVLR
ncbi:hypothetical protein ACP4OV_022845 [Aristida adscensionis]